MSPTTRKEQFSAAYVRAIASVAGVTATRPTVDHDSVDLLLSTRGGRSPIIEAQLKCTGSETRLADGRLSFSLSIKNYEDLRRETMAPRILVVVVVPEDEAEWLEQTPDQMVLRKAAWWLSLRGMPEIPPEQQSVTVHLPSENFFTVDSLRRMMTQAENHEPLS